MLHRAPVRSKPALKICAKVAETLMRCIGAVFFNRLHGRNVELCDRRRLDQHMHQSVRSIDPTPAGPRVERKLTGYLTAARMLLLHRLHGRHCEPCRRGDQRQLLWM